MLQVDDVVIEVDECTIHEISPAHATPTRTTMNAEVECCVGILQGNNSTETSTEENQTQPATLSSRLDSETTTVTHASGQERPAAASCATSRSDDDAGIKKTLRSSSCLQEEDKSVSSPSKKPSNACGICNKSSKSNVQDNALSRCETCQVAVHALCLQDETAPANWKCARCVAGLAINSVNCLFCDQSMGLMVPIDSPASCREEKCWTHIVCADWDPDTERCTTDAGNQFRLVKRPHNARCNTDCTFCHSNRGILIKCRSLDCAVHFHAYCALISPNGRLERVQVSRNIYASHAYCDRHAQQPPATIECFFDKLLTEPVLSVICDVRASLEELQNSMDSLSSVDALVQAIAEQLVSQCEAGAITQSDDTTIMPSFELHHLQVLQMFADHFRQWELLYHGFSFKVTSVIPQDIRQQLTRTFRPSRKNDKHAGPFRQDMVCEVCQLPFHHLQALFYCANRTSSSRPHVQHWKCTKRKSANGKEPRDSGVGSKSTSNDTGSARNKTKKEPKTMKFVENGVMKECKLPKALPSLADGSVVCGVCRSEMDVRALAVTRRDWKKLDALREPSKFAFSGCFVNEMERKPVAKGKSRAGRRGSKKKAEPTDRDATNDESRAATATVLVPQKMERLNVQRTMKWLVLIAQIIHLASQSMQQVKKLVQQHAAESTDDANELAKQVKECRKALMDQVTIVFDEAKQIVRAYDMYAWDQMEQARGMLETRSGPGICVLKHLVQEYTRFVFIKHKRAAEKANLEQQKRQEQEAAHQRKLAQKQRDRQAELALKKQMLAMRKRQKESLSLAARSDTAPSSTRSSPASTPQRVQSPEKSKVQSSSLIPTTFSKESNKRPMTEPMTSLEDENLLKRIKSTNS